MKNHPSLSQLLTIVILWGCIACSSQRNTMVNRAYHNLLTHYNIYWNGEEAFKDGESQLSADLKDDWNQILPVYQTGTQDNTQKVAGQMNRAIEKANKAISRHSIIYNYKEYNKWVDDCYLLLGKASYVKQDYANAQRNFDFVITHFVGEPTYYEAMLWQAKCCIQNEEYERAGSFLAQLQNFVSRESLSKALVDEIPLTYAWLYQKEGNDGLTLKYLTEALKKPLEKNMRSRVYFILGQYNLKSGEFAKATNCFERVLSNNPSFEMAFQAQMNLAQSFDPSQGNTRSLEKSLLKMLREEKNKEYASQLYYALGSLSLKEHNDTLAISRFKMAVATAGNNRAQKAFAALKLGEVLFDKQRYVNSQVYYDTAVQNISESHPEFKKAAQRATMLTRLSQEIKVIDRQDSLQRVARMPEGDRREFINQLIDKVLKQEDLAREAEAKAKIPSMSTGYTINRQSMAANSGEWYFYNPSALSFGYSEFTKRWGRRTLEDNWRLSNKKMVTEFSATPVKDTTSKAKSVGGMAAESNDPHKVETYLKDLPLTPEKIKLSDSLICNALFNSGLIYREGLSDNKRAAAALEEMLSRFPNQPNGAIPYYLLYRIYSDLQDATKIEKYKALLSQKYPESQYAHIANDPGYVNQMALNRNKALSLYDETLEALKKGQLPLVSIYSKEALQKLSLEDPLRPRFEYALALSLIQTAGRDSARHALQNLAVKYPSSPVSVLALNVIKSMNELPADIMIDNQYLKTELYRYVTDQPHRFVILADSAHLNLLALKARMGDWILKQYPKGGINVVIGNIGSLTLFSVSGFTDGAKALAFYDTMVTETYIQSLLKEIKNFQFIISEENLTVLDQNKAPDGYLNFFHARYQR